MLLRHGADPTLRSKDGKSPLDLVAKRRDKTYLDLLTRPGDPRGQTRTRPDAMTGDERRYYATQSRVSDPATRARLLDVLPAEPGRLVAAVSALVLHPLFVGPLGITPPARQRRRRREPHRPENPRPHPRARPGPPRRAAAARAALHRICRDYALAGVRRAPSPSRAGGTASASPPTSRRAISRTTGSAGTRVDDRWRLLDPELSDRVRTHFGIAFDPADVPRDAFLVAGEAWRRVRAGSVDPQICGVPRIGVVGAGFIAASVARDLAALNKREMLAWDVWGLPLALRPGVPAPEATARRLDAVAALTAGPEPDWPAVRDAHDRDDGFRAPAVVTSFGPRGPAQVAVDVEPSTAPATP